MNAAFFRRHGGPEVVEFGPVPTPQPGAGQVRVRVRAASLNHLDLWVRRGLPVAIPLPHVGGSDVAGEVEALGPGVEGIEVGSRVVVDPSLDYDWYDTPAPGGALPARPFAVLGEHCWGGFAESVVVPAANLMALPEGVPFQRAAAAGLVFVTAWHALLARARLQPGERVLITGGSGGVSTAAIQIARRAGAQVFVVTSGGDSVERVRALGAHVVFDRLEGPWGKALWAETGKRGVDVVLDSVGQALWPDLLRALAPYGRLVTYGGTTGPEGATSIPLVFWKQLSILGSTMGTPADFRRVMDLVFRGELSPVIHDVLPLREARAAHETLEAGHVFGKIVLIPEDD
ncbi:MAG: zinc-binding dehydrogenase [Gemmatimonadota bacterium]